MRQLEGTLAIDGSSKDATSEKSDRRLGAFFLGLAMHGMEQGVLLDGTKIPSAVSKETTVQEQKLCVLPCQVI